MPALKTRFSAAENEEEDDDQLRQNPEAADGFKPEAEKEDLNGIDEDDNESDDEDDEAEDEEEEEEASDEEEEEDSKEGGQSSSSSSSSSSSEEESDSEFMEIDIDDIRKDVECPICLGIIKKTRTVMECLHRFCRECIDKSMRLGKNECPACRKHCASRRSLRDDPNFDAFIALFIKNIDEFEKQEITFHEEDEARKKQIQESIAQVSQQQSEALGKRKSSGKETAVVSSSLRPQRIGSGSRGRRKSRFSTPEARDNDEGDDDDDNKDYSSGEASVEIPQRKQRRPSTSTRPRRGRVSPANENNSADSDTEERRPHRGRSPGLVWNPERLSWGKGGIRSSNTRHGSNNNNNNNNNNNSGANSSTARTANRLNRLADYLGRLENNNNLELDIHLKLASLDTRSLPNLPQSYLCCKSTLLVKQLRKYVALQMQLNGEEIELLLSNEKMQSLKDDETLADLKADFISSHEYLIVMYQKKQTE